ncbi:MAG: hypothetical protein QF535_18805, partial [Anaerolineales bacterium]|nr:hypothetical protein [Anaerolineales bacterium]
TFITTGNYGTILTSPDGTTGSWTAQTSGSTKHLRAVAYGNSTFVTVGEAGTILTSNDVTTTFSATVGKLSLSGIDNSTSVNFEKMTSSGNSLYLSGRSNSPMYRVNLVEGDNNTTTGVATKIEPSFTNASYYNTGTEVQLSYVGGFATDGTALYVTDGNNKLIRKIDLATSNISTLAGKLENYADGIGEEAEFRFPEKMIRIGTNIYLIDDYRIRKVNPATGEVSTLKTSGESYDWIEGLTTDGTDIYFTSYFSSSSSSGHKLYKLSVADGVVSELQTSGGSDNSSSSSNIIGLASDGTDLFVARYSYSSGSSGMQVSRIALQTGTLTAYTTTGGESLSYMSGMEKIGDSLFASSSSSIYEIELSGTSATVSKLSLSGIDNSTSLNFHRMASTGNSLY